MKIADVKVGETYYANIGGNLCAVIVVSEITTHDGKRAFRVRRPESINVLPNPRSAAALRVSPVKLF